MWGRTIRRKSEASKVRKKSLSEHVHAGSVSQQRQLRGGKSYWRRLGRWLGEALNNDGFRGMAGFKMNQLSSCSQRTSTLERKLSIPRINNGEFCRAVNSKPKVTGARMMLGCVTCVTQTKAFRLFFLSCSTLVMVGAVFVLVWFFSCYGYRHCLQPRERKAASLHISSSFPRIS